MPYIVFNILEWRVLHLILQEVPQVMQNKALILSRHGNDIDYLAAALCSMVRPFLWIYCIHLKLWSIRTDAIV